jgi:hypothetical protein
MRASFVAFLLLCGVGNGLANAQTTGGAVLYLLSTDTTFVQGCFPPCLCPVMIGVPAKGSFWLTPSGSDGLFKTYSVTGVNWTISMNGTATSVTGSGTYKAGGGSAAQQELSLDLRVGQGSVQHFDSGLVTESVPLPNIEVTISVQGQVCFDSVFTIHTSPAVVPQLQAALVSSNSIVLSWPSSPGSFVLQENSVLASTNWSVVTNAPAVIGQVNQLVLDRAGGRNFYRLVSTD